MKVALIDPYCSITSPTMRQLSSCLKEAGHKVKLVFMPAYPKSYTRIHFTDEPYKQEAIANLAELCSDCGLIGITLMTPFFPALRQMTAILRRNVAAPIICGGIHPTVCAEECLDHADMVCIGEGDRALPELVTRLEAGLSAEAVENVWYKKGGEILRNPIRAWSQNLDELPTPDCDTDSHYALSPDRSRVVRLDKAVKDYYLTNDPGTAPIRTYHIVTMRGCPNNCAFCSNSTFRRILGTKGYWRFTSVNKILEELRCAKKAYDPQYIVFDDDCFLCRKSADLKEFASLYKDEIGIPFRATCTPRAVSAEKMDCLVDAGLNRVQVGVQSGSPRSLENYHRTWAGLPSILKTVELLHRYTPKAIPTYDFICDNPYESRDDHLKTIWLIRDIPKPAQIQTFSLRFYPGSELTSKAEQDGIIDGKRHQHAYRRHVLDQQPTYTNILHSLAVAKLPRPLLRLLTSRAMFFFLDRRWLEPIYSILYRTVHKLKEIRRLRTPNQKGTLQ